jgi:hypothetical protein
MGLVGYLFFCTCLYSRPFNLKTWLNFFSSVKTWLNCLATCKTSSSWTVAVLFSKNRKVHRTHLALLSNTTRKVHRSSLARHSLIQKQFLANIHICAYVDTTKLIDVFICQINDYIEWDNARE